ncbi:unnamed protein product [Acanthoscelides obtectus]|uniref:ABC transporter domain-containing protein n=2 Tax=Acanthoscelides obtectus TaxID=200917 RepID=A0A9P0JIQ4_ACAOB|nr:unnamed protein product [Acanthoscelides obtectus]CAK1657901.1 ATP-binding cassette sub-family A member 3 [Acanthoscelides obtectus]
MEASPTAKVMQADLRSGELLLSSDFNIKKMPGREVFLNNRLSDANVRGFDTEELLMRYFETNHNDTVVVVLFKGDDKNLDYTIRFFSRGNFQSNVAQTSKRYRGKLAGINEADTTSDYNWKGFLSLQAAIDVSFMENVLKRNNPSVLFTKVMPYPPHIVDNGVDAIFKEMLPLITLFSFIFLCPAVLKRVVEEKYSGTKELMKMVGMKSWMLWLGWFIYGLIPMMFAVIVIVILMKVRMFDTEYPPIEFMDGTLLFCFLILYCMAAIVFCFAISSFFSKPMVAMVTGMLVWILSYFIPKYALNLDTGKQIPWSMSIILNLLPNMALHFGYSIIASYEERELGVQWNNFYKPSSGSKDDITMNNVFIMLIVDIVFYMLFTCYMDNVNPGKYGVRKSFLFPLKSLFKFLRRDNNIEVGAATVHLQNVEEGHGYKKGIEIINLCKRYSTKVAVDNLTLDIYQNQITVLLGHNGAGKSTTMSAITGMIEATSGVIKVNGMNIKGNMDEIRKTLGLCPQHNLLFTDLTVAEHLIFFAKLKGKSSEEARREMKDLLKKLNMSEKEDSMAATLSGGMKRKLCLGMAIIGGSKILILDEPSSGMDPESRRELWDLLLKWRGEKTILITTHFMEEADALGDWIAIMANGTLQCYGTPMYLKKKYDTGYHLSIMVKGSVTAEDEKNIRNAITEYVEEAQFKTRNGNNIVYVIPNEVQGKIKNLMKNLETKEHELNIENISIMHTTLEDVFLKVKVDTETEGSQDQVDIADKLTKNCLYKKRFITLFRKKYWFLRRKLVSYAIPIAIASIFFILTVYLSENSDDFDESGGPVLKLRLSSYGPSSVYYNVSHSNDRSGLIKSYYKNLVEADGSTAFNVPNVDDSIIRKGLENIIYYKEHVIAGAEFDITPEYIKATALFNIEAIHSEPISFNLITNSLVKSLLGPDYSISVSNWPLSAKLAFMDTQEYIKVKVTLLWLILIPIGCLFVLGSFILYPWVEKSTKFDQLQYMCSTTPFYYWFINYISDLAIYALIMFVMAGIVSIFSAPFHGGTEFGILYAIFLIYGIVGLPYTYLYSRCKSSSSAFALFIICGLFMGVIPTLVVWGMTEADEYYANIGRTLKDVLMCLCPQFTLTYLLTFFAQDAVDNYNFKVTPQRVAAYCTHEPDMPCCRGGGQCVDYNKLIESNVVWFTICFVIFSLITIVLDTYCFKRIISKITYKFSKLMYGNYEQINSRRDVDGDSQYSDLSLKAKKLKKSYSGKQIVKNINFTLGNGECLGILGVNGAGKTTTFRLLTREEVVDGGEVDMTLNNETIKINDGKYLEQLGYCPQSDALNYVLTGREILTTIASLRGIDDPEYIDNFLKVFDLEKYADIPCGHYSGGNKRKLSLAVSLIGHHKFVLLDEPTNGVDPSGRRKCWDLIKKMQDKQNLSFILTSHSMVECEALCNKLKIMKNGEFHKEGTISTLKNEVGGFSLKIKLINRDMGVDEVDFAKDRDGNVHFTNVEELKRYFVEKCKAEVKDEHSGLLHLYIKDKNKRWSEIFEEVEKISSENRHLIEDFSISEASLEDVFLSVARSDSMQGT